jgi:cyanophycinase
MSKRVSNECPVPQGILYIIGGNENKGQENERKVPEKLIELEVLKAFTEEIKIKNPIIEVITTATGSGDESYKEYKKLFNKLGVKKVGHIHHNKRQEVLKDPLLKRIEAANAIFFSGGDQLKLTSTYGGSTFLTELKNKYIRERIIVGGTSAGAMALSTPMIYAGNKEVEQITGQIKVTTGLEFLKDVCIDTHFVHRGRFVRMAQVIVTNPTCMGVGIEEDTALVVRNGIEAEVIGSGLIIIIDGFHIDESNIKDFTSENPVSIKNLKVHILGRGDKYIIPQVNPPHQ